MSPLPFGVWFSRHMKLTIETKTLRAASPLPFGVWFSRHDQDYPEVLEICCSLHCLSAFGSVVTRVLDEYSKARALSPLPFGVWFSRHPWVGRLWSGRARSVSIAFRRLVQSSLGDREVNIKDAVVVSIAFRRLVQSSLGRSRATERVGRGLHCLSAFGSVVTPAGPPLFAWPAGSPLPFGVWFSRHAQ